MDPDIRRKLTCWLPIAIIESTIGQLAVFALSSGSACEMKTELQDQVLGGFFSDIDFARAAARYICFPVDKLRDGHYRPSKTVLTEEQCLSFSENDLRAFSDIYIRSEFPDDVTDGPLSVLKAGYSKRWQDENEKHAAELRRSFADLGKRIEILAADGVDIDKLSADELLRLLRKPEALKSYERFRDVATFAKQGWFIDAHMPLRFIREAAEFLREIEEPDQHENRASAVEEFQSELIRYYESRYQQIKAEVLRRFEGRGHILSPAFSAHENDLYCLSIPVFIAQADGIFKQSRGFALFCKDGLKSDALFNELLDSIGSRILDRHEISWNDLLPLLFHSNAEGFIPFKSRTSSFEIKACESFNRHAIMHGLCTFYASRENSLRYISLLGYLAWNLRESD